jgi:hypothetical protein
LWQDGCSLTLVSLFLSWLLQAANCRELLFQTFPIGMFCTGCEEQEGGIPQRGLQCKVFFHRMCLHGTNM